MRSALTPRLVRVSLPAFPATNSLTAVQENRMQPGFRRMLSLLAAAGVLVISSAASAQTTRIASSWVPPGHMVHREVMLTWAAAVETTTQGRSALERLVVALAALIQAFAPELVETQLRGPRQHQRTAA